MLIESSTHYNTNASCTPLQNALSSFTRLTIVTANRSFRSNIFHWISLENALLFCNVWVGDYFFIILAQDWTTWRFIATAAAWCSASCILATQLRHLISCSGAFLGETKRPKKAASNTRRPLALRSSRLLQGPRLVLWKLRSTGTAHTRTQGYHQSSDSYFVAVFQTFPGPVLGCIDADFSTKALFCSIFQALQD